MTPSIQEKYYKTPGALVHHLKDAKKSRSICRIEPTKEQGREVQRGNIPDLPAGLLKTESPEGV